MCVCLLSRVQLFATLWTRATVDCRLLCSWNFPGKILEWAGLPFPPPGDLPDTVIKRMYPAWPADCLRVSRQGHTIIGLNNALYPFFPSTLDFGFIVLPF